MSAQITVHVAGSERSVGEGTTAAALFGDRVPVCHPTKHGIVEGWPAPSILTQSSSVQWGKRVTAAGASLAPGAPSDTVFLHLRVYPDALPVTTDGVVLAFHEATGGSAKTTWIDQVTFRATC